MQAPTWEELKAAMEAKGYPFFENGDHDINTIAVRSSAHDQSGELAGNHFNDLLCVAYKLGGKEEVFSYPCTTVPGDYYMKNPMNASFGTAIIVPGFYRGSHMLGLHFGHPALQQVGPLKLYRDKNRDTVLDLDPSTVQETSIAGVNVHYSMDMIQTVDNWSAACIAAQMGFHSGRYEEFIGHYRAAIAAGFKNLFSLGLLVEGDVWPIGGMPQLADAQETAVAEQAEPSQGIEGDRQEG